MEEKEVYRELRRKEDLREKCDPPKPKQKLWAENKLLMTEWIGVPFFLRHLIASSILFPLVLCSSCFMGKEDRNWNQIKKRESRTEESIIQFL